MYTEMLDPTLNRALAHALVGPFYEALNAPDTKDVAALVESVTIPQWRSVASADTSKSRDDFVKQVMAFGKMVPNLTWNVIDVLVDGDQIIVRSDVSGTPATCFMGVPHGGRSFRIMAIDIHTVADGKLARAYHVEDWYAAIRQLTMT